MDEQIIPELSPFNPAKQIKTYLRCHKKTTKPTKIVTESVKTKTQQLKSHPLTTKNAMKYLLEGTLKRKVCRYCLSVVSPLSELDQVLQVAGKRAMYKVTIRDIVASFHPFKVTEDPNFPDKICEKCLQRAVGSYLFTQRCEQAERALRNCFEDLYDKLEKLDPLDRPKKRGRQKLHPNYNILSTEHLNVIDYAEPIINMVHTASEAFTKEDDIKEFECLKCCQVLPNVESLLNHEKSHPVSMWYHCRLCGKAFPKRYRLKRHLDTHKKNEPVSKSEVNLTCNKCGEISKGHNKYLQHLEKHKFKTILEHLVEKKMNRLCSVCLEKSSNMSDLSKEVCLHGGYPELSGDRNLYNILGSTLPDPKMYKYQELMIANKANIVTITKRKNNVPSADNIPNYTISQPIIISKDPINCNSICMFLFSAPQLINEFDGNVSNDFKTSVNNETYVQPDSGIENLSFNSKGEIFTNTEDVELELLPINVETVNINETYEMTKDIESNNSIIQNNKDIEEGMREDDSKMCKICWLFKTPACSEYTNKLRFDNKISFSKIESGYYDKMLPSKVCNYCWLFKHLDKCEICKKSNTVTKIVNIELPHRKNVIDHVKNDVCRTSKDFADTWQCNICLTGNNINTQTCCCCESQAKLDDPVKVNLKQNIEYFKDNKTIHDKPELTTRNYMDDITLVPDRNIEFGETNAMNKGFQITNGCNVESERNITDMEVEITSEKYLKGPTDFQLFSSVPQTSFTMQSVGQMEVEENVETNCFKISDITSYGAHFNTYQPLQFHIGVGLKNKRKRRPN